MKLFCIHGSFQTPSVWEPLANCQAVRNAKLECVAEDLNARTFDGFEHWSEDFCQRWKAPMKESNLFCWAIPWAADWLCMPVCVDLICGRVWLWWERTPVSLPKRRGALRQGETGLGVRE